MSTQSARAFLEKASHDPLIAESITGSTAAEKIASVVSAGHDQGFDFTADEVGILIDASSKSESGELSESELDLVAGSGLLGWIYKALGGQTVDDDDNNAAGGFRG